MSGDGGKPQAGGSDILFYQLENGRSRIEVRLEDGTVWLTQALLAELYQTTPQNITMHIKSIQEDGELDEAVTCKDILQVRREGNRDVERRLKHYNLEMILAVGYRVRSERGAQFRRWASERLTDYLVKGFAIDDERLTSGATFGGDYFDELLERIREIRASEKRFYQKIRDLFTLAVDYDAKADTTIEFFRVVQNKLHWAITGRTAAELIVERSDPASPNMGLTAWKGAKVRKADVTVAKNYLRKPEIEELNRIVTMYLDYAEDQTRRHQPLYMADWRAKLDAFLQFNERDVLANAGTVSTEVAQALAEERYLEYARLRLAESDARAEEEFEQLAQRLSNEESGTDVR